MQIWIESFGLKPFEEVEKGHLLGPYDVDQLPAGAFVNNRFPIKQADKVRPIDNYSSSLINEACRPNFVSKLRLGCCRVDRGRRSFLRRPAPVP